MRILIPFLAVLAMLVLVAPTSEAQCVQGNCSTTVKAAPTVKVMSGGATVLARPVEPRIRVMSGGAVRLARPQNVRVMSGGAVRLVRPQGTLNQRIRQRLNNLNNRLFGPVPQPQQPATPQPGVQGDDKTVQPDELANLRRAVRESLDAEVYKLIQERRRVPAPRPGN